MNWSVFNEVALLAWIGLFAISVFFWRRSERAFGRENARDLIIACQKNVGSILHGLALFVLLSWIYASAKSSEQSGWILFGIFACALVDFIWLARVWVVWGDLTKRLGEITTTVVDNLTLPRWPAVTVVAAIIVVLVVALTIAAMFIIYSA